MSSGLVWYSFYFAGCVCLKLLIGLILLIRCSISMYTETLLDWKICRRLNTNCFHCIEPPTLNFSAILSCNVLRPSNVPVRRTSSTTLQWWVLAYQCCSFKERREGGKIFQQILTSSSMTRSQLVRYGRTPQFQMLPCLAFKQLAIIMSTVRK